MTDNGTAPVPEPAADRGAATGPLAGIRVVELAGLGPGPMASMMLAEMGADVVRVDRPTPPAIADVLDRGRRSIVVDLKHPSGPETVLRLAERADILLEGYRPGVAERLGLGPAEVRRRNPALVYGRMTGWGQQGPRAHTAGHDINYISLTGSLGAIGRAGGPPQIPLNLLGDFGGGALYLVVGVLAALHHARATGQGQVVDAAIVDGVSHLSAMIWAERRYKGWTDDRGSNLLDGGTPYYDVYETADGGWFAVGALEPQFYARLVGLLGLPEWADAQDDRSRWPQMREAFRSVFASRTRAEWEEVFDGTDACASPVLSWSEAVRDPHLAARGVHTVVDGGEAPAPAPRFSLTPGRIAEPQGDIGSRSREVLADWGVERFDELLSEGAVVQRGTPAAR
ncbi:CaiB/BaiF CoA transferase family protein [Peterkaempfera bronchialis]|uniref:CoA transferase n=1 Tax=Peterkaempfera bronchialis TaxID=2126346 RepID=A0A345SR47_9ACTN|nr:CaiB/BaiF CoA-transferase family protein [Peterkaempfera bronchialis]AXI76202.1 CoA transferase [Peterkaempfera bronchialis]